MFQLEGKFKFSHGHNTSQACLFRKYLQSRHGNEPVISALRRLRQENHEIETYLDHIAEPVSKNKYIFKKDKEKKQSPIDLAVFSSSPTILCFLIFVHLVTSFSEPQLHFSLRSNIPTREFFSQKIEFSLE
jgi:hypothetical protein